MLIRHETPADVPAVRAVTGAAFAARAEIPVPVEVTLLDELRGPFAYPEPFDRM